MDLFEMADALAERQRNNGITEAAFAETLVNPDFSETAYAAICHIARRQCEVHVDDVLRHCKATPRHPNAWGAVWMRALKDGTIIKPEVMTVRPCLSDPTKHKHNYPVYESGLFYARKSA